MLSVSVFFTSDWGRLGVVCPLCRLWSTGAVGRLGGFLFAPICLGLSTLRVRHVDGIICSLSCPTCSFGGCRRLKCVKYTQHALQAPRRPRMHLYQAGDQISHVPS